MMKIGMFRDRDFLKSLTRLTLPIAVQSLMLAMVAAADAFMLGGVDQNSMSAVSLASQVQFVQNMILSSAVSAAAILGAQYWGKKDVRSVIDIFFTGIRICMITSIAFFMACEFFPRYLMLLFTDEEVLIEIGITYLRLAGWSYLMTGISQSFMSLLKVTDHASVSARISTVTVIMNIFLNAVFIFGWFGLPAMGVMGAALATLISRTVEMIWSVAISFKKGYICPGFKGLFHRNRILSKDFRGVFLPILGASLLWGIGFTAYSAFMGHMGTDAAAANSVVSVIRDLICCLCNGLAAGGGILVGNELGAGNLPTGKLYGDRITALGFMVGGASALLMLACTPLILRFFKLTEGAKADYLSMMYVMAVYMIGRAVNTVIINGIFSAGGDTMFDMYSLAVTMWGLAVPLAAAGTFLFDWPVWVVYACTCLDEVGKIPWVMIHYKKYRWVRDLTKTDEMLRGSEA